MIFIDSNVPMYLVGADHPNKAIARQLLGLKVHLSRSVLSRMANRW